MVFWLTIYLDTAMTKDGYDLAHPTLGTKLVKLPFITKGLRRTINTVKEVIVAIILNDTVEIEGFEEGHRVPPSNAV
ncbi:hypothetical protein D3C80_1742670 [compost metagenome]